MKLILIQSEGDGATWWSDVYLGIEAESKDELEMAILLAIEEQSAPLEKAAAELEASQTLTPEKRKVHVDLGPFPVILEFKGQTLLVEAGFHSSNILTLDEFFERVAMKETENWIENKKTYIEWLRKERMKQQG